MHAFRVHRIIGGNQTCQRKGPGREKKLDCFGCIRKDSFEQPENYQRAAWMSRACSKSMLSYKQPQEAATIMVQWSRNGTWHVVLVCSCTPTLCFELLSTTLLDQFFQIAISSRKYFLSWRNCQRRWEKVIWQHPLLQKWWPTAGRLAAHLRLSLCLCLGLHSTSRVHFLHCARKNRRQISVHSPPRLVFPPMMWAIQI